jgi:hypothetical protein
MPEVWKICSENTVYQVSNKGGVRRDGRPLKLATKFGYLTVNLYADGKYKTYRVHRLVCAAFRGPCPPGHECAHNDGDRANNRASNLRWATRLENSGDVLRHGRRQFGNQINTSRIPEELIPVIISRWKAGENQRAIAKDLGVAAPSINAVVNGRMWSHKTAGMLPNKRQHQKLLDKQRMRGSTHSNSKLTDDDVRAIRAMRRAGESLNTIAEKFSISYANVGMIARRVTWRHL